MQYSAFTSLLALASGAVAAAVPRQFPSGTITVSNFTAYATWPSEDATYSLIAQSNGHSDSCSTGNSIFGTNPCGDDKKAAALLGPFNNTVCGDGQHSPFSFSLQFANDEASAFWLQVLYEDETQSGIQAVYGCKYLPLNYTCSLNEQEPEYEGYSTYLNAPSEFELEYQPEPCA